MPSILLSFLELITGILLLFSGGEFFIQGSVALALILGIPQLVIGLTVVSLGTSAPELFVSANSSLTGSDSLALSNIIGSNIFNLLGILGLTGLIGPSLIPASSQVLQLHLPVMVGVSVVCLPVLLTDYVISRWEGVLFVVFYVSYVMYMVLLNQQHSFAIPLGNFLIWGMLPIALLAVVWSIMIALRKSRKCNI